MEPESCTRKSERLFSLLNGFLSSPQPLFPQTLADAYGVDLRTIERDLAFLREDLGFPLAKIYQGKCRGYLLKGAAPLVKSLALSPGEIEALSLLRDLGASLAKTHLHENVESLFHKLASHFPSGAAEKQEHMARFFPGPVVDLAPFNRQITAVADGLHKNRKVKIVYTSKAGGRKTKAYLIQPYSIILHAGGLYFFGKKDESNDFRVWIAHRLSQATVTSEPFVRETDFNLDAHFDSSFGIFQGMKAVEVQLKVTGDALREFKEMRLHKSTQLRFTREGALLLTLKVMGFEDLKKFILPYCDGVEVISPREFREEMKTVLQAASNIYRQTFIPISQSK